MNTARLSQALLCHPLLSSDFLDVIAYDQLPSTLREEGSLIVNTHPLGMPGEHWVAAFVTAAAVSYFDSLGMPPLPAVTTAACHKPLLYTPRRVQGSSNLCGYYCLYYLLTLRDSSHSMDVFGDDLYHNDRVVKLLVERLFNVTVTL